MAGLDDQHPGLAVGLQVDPGGERVALQEGQDVVAMRALVSRGVDLQPDADAEHPLGALAEPDQVVERREQGGMLDPARPPRRGVEVGRFAPALHRHRDEEPASTSSAGRALASATGMRK